MPLDWASTNEPVLSVQSRRHIVTAVAAGSAEIFATSGRARGAVMLLNVESESRCRICSCRFRRACSWPAIGFNSAARAIDKHQRPLAYSVRWGVADPNIARVSADGVLEARSPGTVEVYAESNGVRSAARVQVAPPAVAAVQLVADPQRPAVGDRIRVTAMPVDAHGRPLRDRAVVWSVSDTSLVKALSDGVYEAVSSGVLRVVATCEAQRGAIDIAISPPPVASIRIAQPPSAIEAGFTLRLTATPLDAKGAPLHGRTVEWTASDVGIATIAPDGTVTTNRAGDVRMIATCEGKSASVVVTIKPAPVASVTITGLPAAVYVKMPLRLSAIVTDARGQKLQRMPEWRSSNVAVITMSASGQGTALTVGRARIIAIVDGVEGTIDIDVAEPPLPKVVVVPVAPPPAPKDLSASVIMQPSAAAALQAPSPAVPTPVVAPPVPTRIERPRSRRRLGPFVGVGGVVAAGFLALFLVKSRAPNASPTLVAPAPTQSAPSVAPPPQQSAPIPKAEPVTPAPKKSAPVVKNEPASPAKKAPERSAPPAPVPDVFKITLVSPPSTMRIGDRVTLRGTIDRTSGSAPMPRLAWESNRPNVLTIDAASGVATAVAEGQATVSAVGGGTRADVTIGVLAPVVAAVPPQPVRTQATTEAPARPAGPTPEEIRAKGGEVLRDAANAMVAAIKAKDIATATRLFGDGRSNDAQDLLKQLPSLFDLKVASQISQPQFADRSGSVDFQLKIEWTTQVGVVRMRTVNMRAEAERGGDAWTATRQRLISGWR